MGAFIDGLGERTAAGAWALFLTITYRTRAMVKKLNAEVERPQPHPDFVHNFLGWMICWLENKLREPVEHAGADQYGEAGGRIHQHVAVSSSALLAAAGQLAELRRADPYTTRLPDVLRPFGEMLWERAGMNRILPWEMDAGYYIGRYIGRAAYRCNWDFRVGPQPVRFIAPIGRRDVAISAVTDDSSREYRRTLSRWHR
jgi:hypothetical protein